MERILNLTQHNATVQQKEAGVFEPLPGVKESIKKLLTFEKLPSQRILSHNSYVLATIAKIECLRNKCNKVMVGDVPYLIHLLVDDLKAKGLIPVYAFSKRVSIDEPQQDDSVIKIIVFKHEGFIEV